MKTSCKQGLPHDWGVGHRIYNRRGPRERSHWQADPLYKCQRCGKEVEL